MASILDSIYNNDPVKSNENNPPVKKTLLDDIFNNISSGNATDIQLGQYGVGESKFDIGITPENVDKLEEIRANKQGALDKWSNGIVKAAGIAGTSILESTAGVVYGISDALISQDSNKLYNNEFTQSLDSFKDYMSKNLPNYHTKAEQDYNLIQKLGTSNFWSDEFLSGAGFMVGAMATGVGLSKFASLAKLAGAGKIINEAEIAQKGWEAISQSAKGVKIVNALDFGKNAVLMSYGESSIEARGIYNDTKNNLFNDFVKKNGYEPDGKELEEIESSAKSAGNFGFITNLAITGTTNALLFPKLLTKGYSANKLDLNKIEQIGGKFVAESESLTHGISKEALKGSIEEGGQELGQLLTQKTLTDYYSKGYENRGEKQSFIKSLMYGAEQTFGTEEGLENFFLGAILGGPAGGIQARSEIGQKNERTDRVTNILNNTNFKKTVNTFDNFVRATNYEQDKNEALEKGSKFDYLNAEFNQNKSIAKLFLDNGAKDVLIQQYKDIQGLPEEEFKKVTGYELDKSLPKSQVEIVDSAIKFVEKLDNVNNSIKELFPYSEEKYSTPENYKILTDNLWHYSTSIDNVNSRIKDINSEIFKLSADENIDLGLNQSVGVNPMNIQKISNLNSDLEVAKIYRDKLIESYNLLSQPETQKQAFNDIVETAQAESIKSINIVDNTQQNDVNIGAIQPNTNFNNQNVRNTSNSPTSDINDQLDQIDMVENFELDQVDPNLPIEEVKNQVSKIKSKFEKLRQNLLNKSQISEFNNLISNATSEKELDSILDQMDKSNITDEKLLDNISIKRRDIKSPKKVEVNISENIDLNNEVISKSIDSKYDLQGKLAQTVFKTVAGEDNDKKLPEQRYFRFLEKNIIKEGSKLLVVTKNNNKELFDKIQDKDSKDYEEKTKIDTIYTVLVDKDNKLIYSSQKGEQIESGDENNLVYATLLTELGIDSTGVKDKQKAKEELNNFRSELLKSDKNLYLPITAKSEGILVREKKPNGARVFNPVLGYLTTDINKEGLLQLPIISLDSTGNTELKNGDIAQVGKLYGFDDNNNSFDLFARKANENESYLITNLILQRMGAINKTVSDPSLEIDKFIYFGIPKNGLNEKTIGIKDNILYVGKNKTFTKEELATPEAVSYISNFLQFGKNLNVTNKIDFNDSFNEPIFNGEDGTISYKKWDTYQEYLLSSDGRQPIFGTDIPAIGKPRFRNFYLKFDSNFTVSDIKTEVSKEKVDNTENFSTEIKSDIKIEEKSTKNKIFKKSGNSRKINLDRLSNVLSDGSTKLSQEEKEWFKSQFPNISIEEIKGLIDNKAIGRFISSGKVLLSDIAISNTLRHEAFHVVSQLYLTQKEISDIYSETRSKLNNQKLTDLEVEEILAEDFANFKDTGKVLGNRQNTKTIFQKILSFLKKLIGLTDTQIRDIYNRLETGQFLGKQIVGINQFNSLDRSFPGKNELFTKETLDGVDYEFFAVLFENGFTPEKLFQVNNLTDKIYDIVRDSFIDRYNIALSENNQNAIENFKYILENWNIENGIVQLHSERIKSLGVDLVSGINEKTLEVSPNNELEEDINIISEESIVEDENDENRSGDTYKATNTISTKDSMFKQTKLFIKTLPKVDKNGEVILNSLGLPQLVDFNKTYTFLLKNLAGISSYPDMISKLKELSLVKSEFNVLLERLGELSDTISLEQILFQNQFRQDFDKNFAISYKTLMSPDGTIYSVDATKEKTTGVIKNTWKSNLSISPIIKLNDNGRLITTKEDLKSNSDIEFLSKIGINFSLETIPNLENNESFSKAVIGIKKYLIDSKLDITDLYENNSDAKGNINVLLDLEAKYTTNVNELSFLSTEGKIVYSMSLNNSLSITKNIINNSKTKSELFISLPHLNSVYNQNSVWLKEIFDSKGNKRNNININLDLFDGVAIVDSEDKTAKQTSKLSKGDKFVQELNNLLTTGKSAFLRASDKSTEHAISLSSYGKGKFLAIPTESLKEGFNDVNLKSIFRGYFKDEVKKIYELEINNLGKDIDVYRKAGSKWGIFSDFPNSSQIKTDINNKIKELKTSDLTSEEKENNFNIFLEAVVPKIDDATVNFFEKYKNELVKEYENLTFIGNKKLGISKELLDKYSFDQIMRSLAVNNFINVTEQVKLFIGDMSFYKDLFKRTSAATGTKKTARVDNIINSWLNNNAKRTDKKISNGKINVAVFEDSTQSSNYLNEYVDSLIKSGISEEQAKEILSAYTSMDEGDAQGYITLDEYMEFFTRTGDWKLEHQRIFDKIKNNEKISSEEMFYFMPIKAQYFGPQDYNNLYAPAYHKYSLMPLIPQMIKGTNLELLLDNMTKNKIGYSVFKSGSKVGTKVDPITGMANKFYTNGSHGEINSSNLTKQVIDYRFLGIQLDIAPKPKNNVIFGTQFRKLLFSNLFQNGTELDSSSKLLFNEYNSIFNDLISSEKSKLISELGLNDNTLKVENVSKLVSLIQQESKDRNLPDNVIDALQTETINGKVLLKYGFDSMVNQDKIDSLIMSLVNTRLIKQMINGDAMIQGASTGFETKGTRKEGSNDLKFYTKNPNGKNTLPMEVMVPLTGQYKSLLEEYKTIDNINKAIAEGKIDSKKLTLIGYRIPTQGLNSMEYMTIKSFLPETAGNLIILPTEIVAKSGGDYDIDKLNIFRPHFNPKNDIELKQNRIIEISKEILQSESNFNSLITPNSTKILTDIVDEIRYIDFKNQNPGSELNEKEYKDKFKSNLSNIRYTNQLKLQTQIGQFSKFLGGKASVGIGALQNTHHIISQITNLSLNKTYIENNKKNQVEIYFPHNKTIDNKISLSNIKDVSGKNNISEVISQIINASVDIAKDPFMFDLNMNTSTLSTYLYLIRTGIDFEQVAYFMKQPIITEYLNEIEKNKSMFIKVSGQNKSELKIKDSILNKYEKSIGLKIGLKTNELEEYLSDINPRYDITTEELKSNLNVLNQDSEKYLLSQIQLLENYLEYKKQGELLSEAIQSVNHDTAGVGSNLNSSRNKEDQKLNVNDAKFINNNENIYKNTFIGSFDQHDFTIKAFGQFYNSQNEQVVKNNKFLLNQLTTNFTSQKDINKLSNLIQNDFTSYVIQNYGYENISNKIDELFNGDNSIAKQVLKIKNIENPSIEEKLLIDNLFFKELYPELANKNHSTDNLKLYSRKFDTFTSNQLTQSFKELIDLNPELGKNIMDVAILQSGMNKSAISFLNIIPFEYYGDLVNKSFKSFNENNGIDQIEKFNELFIRNNGKESVINKISKKLDLNASKLLGNGMYGKNFDINLANNTLTIEKNNIIDQKTEYLPEVIDNSSNNLEDYDSDLVNNEKNDTFVLSEDQSNKIKTDIESSLFSEEFKNELLSDLSDVDSEKKYADLIRKFCK
jgi:hypothetical protein